MKRLPAYLLVVLGFGLIFCLNVNADKIKRKIKVDQNNLVEENISAWEKSVLATLETEKNDPYCKIKASRSLQKSLSKGESLFKLNFCIKKSDVLKLGEYKKLNYPIHIINHVGACKSDACIRKKAGMKVYEFFVRRGPIYNAKYPGAMIEGMAWFEIFYLDRLKKSIKSIKRYNENNYKGIKKFKKTVDQKNIYSLIKMNNGRIKMREALGFNLYDDTEEVINKQILLANFLNKDELTVERNLLTPEMIKRRELIKKYKSVLNRYKKKLEEEKKKKNAKKS